VEKVSEPGNLVQWRRRTHVFGWAKGCTFPTNRKISTGPSQKFFCYLKYFFWATSSTPPLPPPSPKKFRSVYHFRGQNFFPDIPKFFVTLKNFSGHHQFSPFIQNFPNIPTSPTLTISDNVYNCPKISDNIDNFPTGLDNRGGHGPPGHGATDLVPRNFFELRVSQKIFVKIFQHFEKTLFTQLTTILLYLHCTVYTLTSAAF
jgi:hypothetical protein